MLIKCETKSNRVKGLSFHPKLSWILASLHNGVIQLWDYRIGSLIDRFEDHEGPVRGVDFHPSQPLFVSGGDDYRVKVWNYRQRRCIFTLLGHLDYIRTVYFHQQYPWILSASDDQTVRIWNWQSRNCLAVLTGHGHYVMCAQFHPKSDLVVSASLDQAIRVWDVSGLREKTVSSTTGPPSAILQHQHAPDMFGASDAVCKFILEGHDRGVNWAAFHATAPLIASGADDRHIKLWRYNDTKAWEVDTLRGHFNNVSCVMFHPTRELLLSNSEDRTIRVWDVNKRAAIHTFRRENDRCWILTALRNSNLIAVGHDSGMVVFKLDRERPAHDCTGSTLFIVKEKLLMLYDLTKDAETYVVTTRRPTNPMCFGPRLLTFNHFNPTEFNVLLFFKESDTTPASYDLITAADAKSASVYHNAVTKTGNGVSVAFVSRTRFAVLESGGSIGIYNMSNELGKRIEPPVPVDKIFSATSNRLLLKCEERVLLYDVTNRKVLGEANCPGGVRYAVWSQDYQHVALISKHNILLATGKLEYLHSLHENIRMKSGCWDDCGAFVYSTLSHVKYCLTNGDFGIIHSLANPIYIFRVAKQTIYYLDRHQQVKIEPLNTTEFLFKLALQKHNFDQVALYIRNGRLCGNAVIGYLKRKGYPEVAMQFVSDPKTRFNLSLEFGHMEEATAAATKLDDKAVWHRLGVEALRQGNHFIVETVFQKIKNFDKLSFLYLISGNFDKLRKMLKIAEMRKDIMGRFHNALMVGDVEERVKVLAEVGQLPLAVLAAKVHKLEEFTKPLGEAADGMNIEANLPSKPMLFLPPIPLHRHTATGAENNWPLIGTTENVFANAMEASEGLTEEAISFSIAQGVNAIVGVEASATAAAVRMSGGAHGDLLEEDAGLAEAAEEALVDDGVWGDFDDAFGDIGDDMSPVGGRSFSGDPTAAGVISGKADNSRTDLVSRGETPQRRWLKGQPMVGDLIAAGEFEEALATLQRRIALINVTPLKPLFTSAYQAANASLPGLPQTPSIAVPMLRDSCSLKGQRLCPMRLYTPQAMADLIRSAQKDVTGGNFVMALRNFRTALQCVSLATAASAEEEAQLHEYLAICRSYVTAMQLECTRLALSDDEANAARNIELAVYFACCKMQPTHSFLVVRRAIGICNKNQNYITAAALCRRLLQSSFGGVKGAEEELKKAKRLLIIADQKGTDKHVVDFEPSEKDSLQLCAVDFKRLLPGEAMVRCPFCSATAGAAHRGKLCPTCDLSSLGERVIGIQFRAVTD